MPSRWVVVYDHFPKIMSALDQKVDLIVAKAAMDIQAHGQTRAPVDTGHLKGSIQALRVGPMHWRVTVGADYGIYVEFGTVNTAAQPYFHPAIEKVRPQFINALKGAL